MFQFLLDFIYPKRCVGCSQMGAYLCPNCFKEVEFLKLQYCPACKFVSKRGLTHEKCKRSSRLDGIHSLVIYEGAARKLIQKIKYRGAFDILNEIMPRFLNQVALEFEPELIVVPVPLHKDRHLVRGFNQSELIARKLGQIFGETYSNKYLVRVRNTTTQTSLTREERMMNLKNAFLASVKVKHKSFLLVDDVWTTGATLNEAARELKKRGAKQVYAFTIAMGK